MLRIDIKSTHEATYLILQGTLTSSYLSEVKRAWQTALNSESGKSILVDLANVTFIDFPGMDLLSQMHKQGVKLMAKGCMNNAIVDEINEEATLVS